MSDGRLPLTLLGGALGSGKTTWARHQLYDGAFGTGVHVLVNEAAEVPVDDQLLARAEGVTVLAGGCVCCTGQQALLAALRDLCDRRSRGAGPERVLLETSGLADPGAIAACLRADPVLARHLRLDGILVAIDAVHALTQLAEDPLIHRQIAVADRLILTKVDVVPDPSAVGSHQQTISTTVTDSTGAVVDQTTQTTNKKLTFISAHSTNILPVLNILNLTSV